MKARFDELVATKLSCPPVSRDVLPRPAVLDRLSRNSHARVTLLSAGAGFGKTTLLSAWRVEPAWRDRPVVWLTLDRGDNDARRFWQYCAAALQPFCSSEYERVKTMLRSPRPWPVDVVPGALINALDPEGPDCWLVLDDVDVIETHGPQESLSYFVEHMPANLRLIIASRHDPALPLARLRAHGQLFELRERDLRFSPDETSRLLNDVRGLELDAGMIESLHRKTEGWVTGLHLAAHALKGIADSAAFVETFSGTNRYVVDYLIEEVLDRQPEAVRRFLLETSIPDRLNADLCNALTGRTDGQDMLRLLETANLFVVPLDQARNWYRYHTLFGELLRQRLAQLKPDRVRALHAAASYWYEQHSLQAEAIEHAFAAGDPERAACLIEAVTQATFIRGELFTLLRWLDRLPPDVLRGRKWLWLFYARVLFLNGRIADADESLSETELSLTTAAPEDRAPDAEAILTDARALQALVAATKGEIPRALDICRDALDRLPATAKYPRGRLLNDLAIGYLAAGDPERSAAAGVQAARCARELRTPYLTIDALSNVARAQALAGRLREAARTCQEGLSVFGESDPPATGMAHVTLAEILYEWNDLAAAASHVETGVQLGATCGIVEIALFGHLTMARIRHAQGQPEAALDALDRADRLAQRWNFVRVVNLVGARRAELSLALGDLEEAGRWADGFMKAQVDMPGYLPELEELTAVRVLLTQPAATFSEANKRLERLLAAAIDAHRLGSAIRIIALRALALQTAGSQLDARATLGQALALAQPEGYLRTFVDEGPAMAALLRDYAWADGHVKSRYMRKLLGAARGGDAGGATDARRPPLSWRELEVLQLLPTHLDTEQIAERLIVSVNTVKTHLKHLYRKLGVNDRSAAVLKAQQLNLL